MNQEQEGSRWVYPRPTKSESDADGPLLRLLRYNRCNNIKLKHEGQHEVPRGHRTLQPEAVTDWPLRLYQSHLKKLEKIREERKNQLAFDNTRLAKQQEFRHAKSRSFAHRYNEHNQEITQSNIKFLNKLEKVRPFTHHASFSGTARTEREQQTMTPMRRQRQEETEK